MAQPDMHGINDINRRRFLALCGIALPGIWFVNAGLIRLPAETQLLVSGWCSFCAKEAEEVFGLAGVTHRPDRICDECLDLCLETLVEEHGWTPPPPQLFPPSGRQVRGVDIPAEIL